MTAKGVVYWGLYCSWSLKTFHISAFVVTASYESRNSSVDIVTTLRTDHRGIVVNRKQLFICLALDTADHSRRREFRGVVRFQVEPRDFTVLWTLQRSWGASPYSYQIATRAVSVGTKWLEREADHSLIHSIEFHNVWSFTPIPPCTLKACTILALLTYKMRG